VNAHSNTIVGFLIFEFVVFIVTKGELAKYKGYLFG
jgi:hypothetical protein